MTVYPLITNSNISEESPIYARRSGAPYYFPIPANKTRARRPSAAALDRRDGLGVCELLGKRALY